MLLAMRFKTFIWPNNPKRYTLSCERLTAVHKYPLGGYTVQDLGKTCTVLRGEGEFFGSNAYAWFQALETVFFEPGSGALVHPAWQSAHALFTELQLTQEPRADYVAYSFAFCDAGDPTPAVIPAEKYHVLTAGQTLWTLCTLYGLTMQTLLTLNPKISDPNAVRIGTEVRVG